MPHVDRAPQLQGITKTSVLRPTADTTLGVYDRTVYAVPQSSDITLLLPSPSEAFGFGIFHIVSNGNAAGDVIISCPQAELADVTLTADDDHWAGFSDGIDWVTVAEVST